LLKKQITNSYKCRACYKSSAAQKEAIIFDPKIASHVKLRETFPKRSTAAKRHGDGRLRAAFAISEHGNVATLREAFRAGLCALARLFFFLVPYAAA
jgi:hypothetical protein